MNRPPSGAQSTYVVDPNGGAGVGFISLPAAVAAAATGDTLLMAPGRYDPFHATGKTLRIIGAGGRGSRPPGLRRSASQALRSSEAGSVSRVVSALRSGRRRS